LKIYENVVIGNFLYTLGLELGLQRVYKPSMINLLQQTPCDKYLGDMLLEYPGVIRLFEFKNKASSLKKEKDKLRQIEICLNGEDDMIEVSRGIHWYIETEPKEDYVKNRIVPYLDAFDTQVIGDKSIEIFIEEMVQEIIDPSYTIDYLSSQKYLDLIKASQGNSKGAGTGGVIINITDHGIRYVQVSDFSQLRLQHKEYVLEIEKMNESVMKQEHQLIQERQITRDRGFSLGRM